MRRNGLLLCHVLLLLVCLTAVSYGQTWSGILSSNRAVDWSNAGVPGGIPTRSTACATFNPGATAAQINAQLQNSACANRAVVLNAGTYNLSAGLDFGGNSNVTLRGAGADLTFLVFSNDTGCQGIRANICVSGNDLGYYAPGPPTHVVNWTAGYAKGTTVITLNATTGLSVGMDIVLDQLNDSLTSGMYVCTIQGTCTDEGGGGFARANRGQRQQVKVTNISGSNVTISPGLYDPNWASGLSPQAWWGNSGSMSSGDGIENLSADFGSGQSGYAGITLAFTRESWVKGVRSINGPSPKAHIVLYQSARSTVRDSYLYGSAGDAGASTNYGIEAVGGGDNLIENNICQRRSPCYMMDGNEGTVVGYNLAVYDHYTASPTFLQVANYSHEVGNSMILHEGNSTPGLKGDMVHGTANMITGFRNYWAGWETGKAAETNPVKLYSFNRFYNIIGNVLGRSGYHDAYATSSASSIYAFDSGNIGVADAVTASSMMRWGNYDTVNDAVRFVSTEVPTTAFYPNSVPASQTLPASFYLNAKPAAWWGVVGQPSIPWPPIGPDVTGGNIANVGGHANKIPAQVCYESIMHGPADGTGNPLTFNANACYGVSSSSSGSPAPPTNLSVVVQ